MIRRPLEGLPKKHYHVEELKLSGSDLEDFAQLRAKMDALASRKKTGDPRANRESQQLIAQLCTATGAHNCPAAVTAKPPRDAVELRIRIAMRSLTGRSA